MTTNTHGTTVRSARILLAGAIATATLASGSTALAHGDRTIPITGNSVFSDCAAAGADFGLLMSGDLKGCLSIFIQNITCTELTDFDHYVERGREAFDGAWRGNKGKFATKYVVDAAYGKGFCQSLDYTLELSGSCIHHVEGRSGVFADTKGVFKLFDVVTNVTGDPVTGAFTPGSGGNNFLYYGRIETHGRKGSASAALEDTAAAQSRSVAVAAAAVQKARSGHGC
jgi:hypothetical protein